MSCPHHILDEKGRFDYDKFYCQCGGKITEVDYHTYCQYCSHYQYFLCPKYKIIHGE